MLRERIFCQCGAPNTTATTTTNLHTTNHTNHLTARDGRGHSALQFSSCRRTRAKAPGLGVSLVRGSPQLRPPAAREARSSALVRRSVSVWARGCRCGSPPPITHHHHPTIALSLSLSLALVLFSVLISLGLSLSLSLLSHPVFLGGDGGVLCSGHRHKFGAWSDRPRPTPISRTGRSGIRPRSTRSARMGARRRRRGGPLAAAGRKRTLCRRNSSGA